MFINNEASIINMDFISGITKDDGLGLKLSTKGGWYTWDYDTKVERDMAFDKIKRELDSKEI